MEPISPGPGVKENERQSVPPPPSGYHIRIVPSSADSWNENLFTDDLTWTQTEVTAASECNNINSHSESLGKIGKLSHCESLKKHLPIQEMKEHFKRAVGETPCRFASPLKSKTKKLKTDPSHVPSTEKAANGQNHSQATSERYSCGAFGDAVWEVISSETNAQGVHKDNLANVGDKQQKCHENDSDHIECEHVVEARKLRAAHNSSNRRRLRHTVREGIDFNINSNTMSSTYIQINNIADSTPPLNRNTSDFSHVIPMHHLNTNMNAFPGNESVHEGMPGDHQEVISEHNPSSTTPSVDQFYTPESSSPGSRPEAVSELALEERVEEVYQDKLEEVLPDLTTSLLESPTSVKDEIQEQATLEEREREYWEAKKRSIMMACNEAIKNRLKRQETDEEGSRELTSSESASTKNSSEKRKKRKKKTTESVCVKFKTSLSKKMTTTTTLKEVKQSTQGISAKTLMLENDHQNALGLASLTSEQSLSIAQPRHTRIIKCAELENQVKKRKLSSDTEVELMHLIDSSKQPVSVSKSLKDGIVRDHQINKKENTYVETFAIEEHSMDTDRQDASQVSPRIPHGELTGEYDKLSEKASVITVINVLETSDAAEKMQSDETVDREGLESCQAEECIHTPSLSLARQSGQGTTEGSTSRERAKRRKKPSKQTGGKKSEAKRVDSKTRDAIEISEKDEATQGHQSETSLSRSSKKFFSFSSSSKALHHAARSHSSPPDCRKKTGKSKKKTSVHLLEPSETDPNHLYKMQKKLLDKKMKVRQIAMKENNPRNTGSTSSTNSEKKRKSQTTASSLSMDSVEDDQQVVEKASLKVEQKLQEIEVTLPTVEMKDPESPNALEAPEVPLTENEILPELVGQAEGSKKKSAENLNDKMRELKVSTQYEINKDKTPEHVSQTNESYSLKSKSGVRKDPSDMAPIPQKSLNKIPKLAHIRSSVGHHSKDKDLQKAEDGWNNSISYSTSNKGKVVGEKAKCAPRRPKLKYVLVKAKDKIKEAKKVKDRGALTSSAFVESISPHEVSTDQTVKQDGQGDSSLRGQSKTVQFSESIENIENLKQSELHAQEALIGDNASDGSLGDMFLSNNFDLVRELVEEEAEDKHKQSESVPNPNVVPRIEKQKSSSPRRNRRPVWLKKTAPKAVEEPIVVETRVVTSKLNMSPLRLEKKKESFEEVILKPKKCNIEVTNPVPPSGMSPKREMPSAKTRVAYSSMLSNVFLSLPLKKEAKVVIAETGSPVDIKEVIEGSSVDAADYAKNLRYSPKTKRVVGIVSSGIGRKKGALETPVGSGSARSPVSRDNAADHRLTTASCSPSTDLDEAAVYRPVHSAPSSRSTRTALKKVRSPGRCDPQISSLRNFISSVQCVNLLI